MCKKSLIHFVFLPILAGSLLGVAFWHASLWWLALLGGLVFLLWLANFNTARDAFWFGWIVGTVKVLLVTVWVWGAYPLDWMGFESGLVQVLLISSFWLLAAVTLGAGYGALAAGLHHLEKRQKSLMWPTIIFGFLLADMAGSFLLSVVMLGPGSSLNISYSNGWLGYVLAEHGLLIWFAQYGGAFALTVLYGGLVAVGYYLWQIGQKRSLILGALIFIVTSNLSLSFHTPTIDKTVAVVTTSFARAGVVTNEIKQSKEQVYAEVVQALSDRYADYLVWPEDARFSNLLKSTPNRYEYLRNILGTETVVVDTARNDTWGTVLRAYIYDTHMSDTYTFDKQYLVPQGEYIPYLYRFFINLIGIDGRLAQVVGDMSYQPGIGQSTVAVPDYVPAVLFCFESMDPNGVRKAVKNRAEVPFVAHTISHARFHESPNMLWHQLDAMLRVQAVWNQVTIVQAANRAHGTVYLPDGSSYRLLPAVAGERWYISYLEI